MAESKTTHEVEAKLSAKDDGMSAVLERIETALAALNATCQKISEIMIRARDAGATKTINQVSEEVKSLDKAKATPEITADNRAGPEVAEAQKDIEKLDEAKAEAVLEAKNEVTPGAEQASDAIEAVPEESMTALEAVNHVTPEAEEASDAIEAVPEESVTALEAANHVTPEAEQAADSVQSVPEESMTALEAANHVTPAAEQAADSVNSIPESDTVSLEAEDHVSGTVDDVVDSLGRLEDKAETTKKKLGESLSFGIGSAVGQKALGILTDSLKSVSTGAVEVGQSFDASMSKVKALQGNKLLAGEFEALTEAARKAGAETQFSATQASEALQYMALAGWDAQKSVDTLPAVLNLAAASGMDLARASDIVTDYVSAFSNSNIEAAEMVDLLSFAQSNSNTTTDQLAEAWRNCAANLNAAGQDVQTTTSFLEAMANQGLKGSEAGTAMAAMMRDITQQMENGAIAIGKTTVAVQDEHGNFRDLTAIMKDVESATAGMGDAEKAAALSATFTADSQRGVNMLLNEGMDKVAGYEEALRSCSGAAKTAAAVMNNNLAGDLKTLGSAWEAVQISIYEKVEPALRIVTQSATKVLTAVNNLISGWKAWTQVMRGGAGEKAQEEFNRLSAPVKDLFAMIRNLQTAWSKLQQGFASSGAMEAVRTALSSVRDALSALGVSLSGSAARGAESFGQTLGRLVKIIADAVAAVAGFMKKLNANGFGQAIAGVAGVIAAFKGFDKLKSLNPLGGFLKNFKKGTSSAAKTARTSKSTIAQIFESLGSVLTSAGTAISAVFQGVGKAIGSLNITGAASFVVVIAGLTAAFIALAACQSVVLPFLQGLSDILVSIVNGALQAVAGFLVALSPIMKTMAEALSALSPLVVAFGEALAAAAPFVEAMGAAIGTVVTAIGGAAAQIATALAPIVEIVGGVFTQCVAIVSDAVVRIVEALAPYIPEVTRLAEVTAQIVESVTSAFNTLVSNIAPIIQSITDLVTALGDSIATVFDSIASVITSVGGVITGILDSIAGIIDSIGKAALNAGRGFEALASGIATITSLNIWDMGASLAAVATGLAGIGSSAGSVRSASDAMSSLIGSIDAAASGFGRAFSTIVQGAQAGMNGTVSAVRSGGTTIAAAMKSAAVQANVAFKSSFTVLPSIARQAMSALSSAVSSGSRSASSAARSGAQGVISAFRSGYSGAYSAGAYISQGLARGMYSAMGAVRAAATELAAQAQKAIEAKAKIASPSKITTKDGEFIGMGLAKGIESMKKRVWKAAEELVSYGSLSSPLQAAFAGGALSLDGDYRLVIEVNPDLRLDINGREFARATAMDTRAEIGRKEAFEKRLEGR